MNKTAFVYTDAFQMFDYGPTHPLRISRLKLAYDMIKAFGLLSLPNTCIVEPEMAGEEELLWFHTKEYLDVLKAANKGGILPHASFYGLGQGDNPIFKGVYDWSRLVAGASLQAASMISEGGNDVAFNIAGGLHHAMSSRASGFCYINDIVLAILSLLRQGKRIAYVDIDAHHGDGVQEAFYRTDTVLTISIHETGEVLFPGTGFEYETGKEKGEGYAVNVPMPPYADDDLFVSAFHEVVPPLIEKFKPDVVFTQLGVDSFSSDPLAHLNYTNNGFSKVVRKIKSLSPKWVALGGGGYNSVNVARAWTLAWAIMNDVDIPDEIPDEFLREHAVEGFAGRRIMDEPYVERGIGKEQMREEVERRVSYIREKVIDRMPQHT